MNKTCTKCAFNCSSHNSIPREDHHSALHWHSRCFFFLTLTAWLSLTRKYSIKPILSFESNLKNEQFWMLRIKSDYDLRPTIKTLCRACQSHSEIPIQPFHQRKFMEIIKTSQEISFSGLLWAKYSPALRSNTRFRIFSLFSHNLNMSIVYLISARLYLTNFSRWHVCYAYLPFPKIMARKTHKIERKYNKMVMITRKTNDSNDNDRNEKEEAHRNKKKAYTLKGKMWYGLNKWFYLDHKYPFSWAMIRFCCCCWCGYGGRGRCHCFNLFSLTKYMTEWWTLWARAEHRI